MTHGELIKKIRLQAGLKSYQFADAIGTSKVHLSLVERGRATVGLQLLEKVAKFKGVPVSVLLWDLITIEDVLDHKKEPFQILKPTVDMIIKDLFGYEPISK